MWNKSHQKFCVCILLISLAMAATACSGTNSNLRALPAAPPPPEVVVVTSRTPVLVSAPVPLAMGEPLAPTDSPPPSSPSPGNHDDEEARPEDAVPAESQAHEFVVRPQDTLSQIAECFGVKVSAIRRLNGLGHHSLTVGQILRLPARANPNCTDPPTGSPQVCVPTRAHRAELAPSCVHTVHEGETVSKIAAKSGHDEQYLWKLNGLVCDRLLPGDQLLTCEDARPATTTIKPSTAKLQPQVPPNLPGPPPPRCETRLRDRKDRVRTVFFVGGELSQLFRKYRALLKQAGVDVTWSQLKAVYVDAGGQQQTLVATPIGFAAALRGATPLSEWLESVEGRSAAPRPRANEEAPGADVVCGS